MTVKGQRLGAVIWRYIRPSLKGLMVVLAACFLLIAVFIFVLYLIFDDEKYISDRTLANYHFSNPHVFQEALSTAYEIKRRSRNDHLKAHEIAQDTLYHDYGPFSRHSYIEGVELHVWNGLWLRTSARDRDRIDGVTRLLDKYYWYGFSGELPEGAIVTTERLEDAWSAHKANNTDLPREVFLMKPLTDGWYLVLKADVYDY